MRKLLLPLLFFVLSGSVIGLGGLAWKEHQANTDLERRLEDLGVSLSGRSHEANFLEKDRDLFKQQWQETTDAWQADRKKILDEWQETIDAWRADRKQILDDWAKDIKTIKAISKPRDSSQAFDEWFDRQRAIDAQERAADALEDLSFQAQWDSLQREIDKPLISYPRKKSGE